MVGAGWYSEAAACGAPAGPAVAAAGAPPALDQHRSRTSARALGWVAAVAGCTCARPAADAGCGSPPARPQAARPLRHTMVEKAGISEEEWQQLEQQVGWGISRGYPGAGRGRRAAPAAARPPAAVRLWPVWRACPPAKPPCRHPTPAAAMPVPPAPQFDCLVRPKYMAASLSKRGMVAALRALGEPPSRLRRAQRPAPRSPPCGRTGWGAAARCLPHSSHMHATPLLCLVAPWGRLCRLATTPRPRPARLLQCNSARCASAPTPTGGW